MIIAFLVHWIFFHRPFG